MDSKRVIITSLVTIVGFGGIVSGALLLRQRQDLQSSAAVPGGKAQLTLTPVSGSFEVGDSIPVSVYFKTKTSDTDIAAAVSGVAVRVTYPYTGATPEISASDVEINPNLLSTGDWSCPTNNVTTVAGSVNIDIACANISASGYTANSDSLLATFNLTINRTPSAAPFTIRFDPSNSVITEKNSGEDILALPQSVGSYSIGGAVPTSTVGSPTPTTSLTTSLTPTVTKAASATPTKVSITSSTLPDAGYSLPTLVGIGLGVIAIFASLVFAL